MLTIPQIEALRTTNPQLYESLKRLAGASLGPNQGWSLDSQITDGDNYARVASAALTSGQIDPTKSGVLMKGSVPPSWSGSFTYASTTSSLTWSWTALSIYRADGTTTAITDGSSAITGLATGATYYFYPYWDEVASALGWVAGGAGSSGFAQSAKTNSAAQQQSLQGRVPLSQGAIVAATTTSGTGGGSGGGSGSCLRAGSMVLTQERGTVPIESCKVGEHLRCPSPAAGESWTRIIRLEVRDAETFIRLHFSNAESLDVTPHHIFTLADGSPMRAERLCLSDVFIGRFARLTLTRIEAISASAARSTSVGAQHAVPGTNAWREVSHPPQSRGEDIGALLAAPSSVPDAASVEARGFSPAKSAPPQEGLQPRASSDDAPWQKVTITCEPSHQFFAGRHSASILTHNYTFSS
jgi:hypothetical protein